MSGSNSQLGSEDVSLSASMANLPEGLLPSLEDILKESERGRDAIEEDFLELGISQGEYKLDDVMKEIEDELSFVKGAPSLSSLSSVAGDGPGGGSLDNSVCDIASKSFFTKRNGEEGSLYHVSGPSTGIQEEVEQSGSQVLNTSELKKISSLLRGTDAHLQWGLPTCVAAGSVVAVGMSRGHILLFDFKQRLIATLGGWDAETSFPPVTAIDMNSEQNRLVSCHEGGDVYIWSLTHNSLIRKVFSREKEGNPALGDIYVAKFCFPDMNYICTIDDGGSLYLHWYSRAVMGYMKCGSACLMAGERGAVTAVSPLPKSASTSKNHPVEDFRLIAVITLNSVNILSLKGKPKVLYVVERKKNDPLTRFVPLLDWRPAYENASSESLLSPVLIFTWGTKLHFLKVGAEKSGELKHLKPIKCAYLGYHSLGASICFAQWISVQYIVVIDGEEKLHLLDPKTLKVVEVANISRTQLIFQDNFGPFKAAFRSGGNVPNKNFEKLTMRSYFSSICVNKETVLLMGIDSMFKVNILTYSQRVTVLMRKQHFLEALEVGYEAYKNLGMKGKDMGILPDRNALKARLGMKQKICQVLKSYVNHVLVPFSEPMERMHEARVAALEDACFEVSKTIIHYAVLLDSSDSTLNELFLSICRVSAKIPRAKPIFLEVIYKSTIEKRLTHFPIEILRELAQMYLERGGSENAKKVEHCILVLDIERMNVSQTIEICEKNQLFSALIYAYNKGMKDYLSPLKILLEFTRAAMSEESVFKSKFTPKKKSRRRLNDERRFSGLTDEQISSIEDSEKETTHPFKVVKGDSMLDDKASHLYMKNRIGYKLFLYIYYSLSGRAFPSGFIDEKDILTVKAEVYNFIFDRSTASDTDEWCYPNLTSLLDFDTKEFLRVLSLVFDDDALEAKFSVSSLRAYGIVNIPPIPDRQLIVDILLDVNCSPGTRNTPCASAYKKEYEEGEAMFVPSKEPCDGSERVMRVYLFVANQLILYPNSIYLSKEVLIRMFENLVAYEDDHSTDERQSAIRAMFEARLLVHVNHEEALKSALASKMFQVCEYLYNLEGRYDLVVSSIIQDHSRQKHIFEYSHRLLSGDDLNPSMRESMITSLSENCDKLTIIDRVETAKLVMLDFPEYLHWIISHLSDWPEVLFEFLDGIFHCKDIFRESREEQVIDPEIHEQYFELMCELYSKDVFMYIYEIMMNSQTSPMHSQEEDYAYSNSFFRISQCLSLCEKYHILDAQALLMEYSGDVGGAIGLLLNELKLSMEAFETLSKEKQVSVEDLGNMRNISRCSSVMDIALSLSDKIAKAESYVSLCTQLCQRSSSRLDVKEAEALWFSVIDVVVCRDWSFIENDISSKDSVPDSLSSVISKLMRQIFTAMMGYVSLPRMLDQLLQNPSISTRQQFGDFREIVTAIVESFQYEYVLLSTTNEVISDDICSATRHLLTGRSKAVTPKFHDCRICGLDYKDIAQISSAAFISSGPSSPKVSPNLVRKNITKSQNTTVQIGGTTLNVSDPTKGTAETLSARPTEEDGRILAASVIFQCGHTFHVGCLEKEINTRLLNSGSDKEASVSSRNVYCVVCNHYYRRKGEGKEVENEEVTRRRDKKGKGKLMSQASPKRESPQTSTKTSPSTTKKVFSGPKSVRDTILNDKMMTLKKFMKATYVPSRLQLLAKLDSLLEMAYDEIDQLEDEEDGNYGKDSHVNMLDISGSGHAPALSSFRLGPPPMISDEVERIGKRRPGALMTKPRQPISYSA
eukprot:Nk52_evm35s2474 gene=Nk52_evmTU35s2474